MRWGLVLIACAMAGCAEPRLKAAPPAGVDLSGHWMLNVADSDDAERLMQSQLAAATAGAAENENEGGGRGGQRGPGRRGFPGPVGPAMPPVALLDESLRWPGRELTLTQSADAIRFVSDGAIRSCHPGALKNGHRRRPSGPERPQGRESPSRGRGDAPQPRCGWDEHSLVVRSGESEEDAPPFEQRFSLSDDGQRLVEVVVFHGGRSSGFVASREWDRAPVPGGPAGSGRQQ